MLVSQGPLATKAGKRILDRGGNLFDAFATMSFMLAVERPQSTGLGGGGFLLYYKKGMPKPVTVDFREMAPLKATGSMFQDAKGKALPKRSQEGPLAVGVPGFVAGILAIHKKFGRLPLKIVLEPAIALAERGLKVDAELDKALRSKESLLKRFSSTREIFFKKGRPLKKGDRLVQRDLAETLKRVALEGKNGFYRGETAKLIEQEMRSQGGLIGVEDLMAYTVKERPAIEGAYKDFTLYSMGPPSAGGIQLMQILSLLEGHQHLWNSPERAHLMASAMHLSFTQRAAFLGDSDFVSVPVEMLVSKDHAKKLKAKIKSHALEPQREIQETKETTHLTLMDSGTVISSTQTINGWFGSGIVVPKTGVLLNNEMDDFTSQVGALNLFGAVGGEKNAIHPQKRPLSSMGPTIVFKKKNPLLALGAPGGTRILTCIAQVLHNVMEYNMPLDRGIASPRIHHQGLPNFLEIEESFPAQEALEKKGYRLKKRTSPCKVQGVIKRGDILHGVSDPRGRGESLGGPL